VNGPPSGARLAGRFILVVQSTITVRRYGLLLCIAKCNPSRLFHRPDGGSIMNRSL
jgi:hypothetical protein